MTEEPGGWRGLDVLVLSPTPTHPQDYGNRKRVRTVCAALKARGAAVHFVHYASEVEWRRDAPLDMLREMQAAWDSVWTVPATRPLHAPAAGAHHDPDEWWDPAIGDMLRWLFSVRRFDVLLVNYTWLSKALELAPAGVVRILDTHDRFSGRREMLEANGLAPEFFYLTEEGERAALRRADLVWAIKDEEAAFFGDLAGRPVLTLPHSEPPAPLGRDAPPRGILRFGIVGARNNVNRRNIEAFLGEALRYVERTLLPCEILVAGSICVDLRTTGLPAWIRLTGRVPDMAEFYRGVDAVLAPMTFSSGLKIKVAEALSHGKALIAHAHAFEGFRAAHAFHALPDYAAMLDAMTALVADPAQIGRLEEASLRAAAATGAAAASTLDATAAVVRRLPPSVCLVLDGRDLREDSLRLDHLCEAGRYLAWEGPVFTLLAGRLPRPAEARLIARLEEFGPVAATPGLIARDGERLPATGRRVRRRSLEALAAEGHVALWLASPLPLEEALPASLGLTAFVPLDAQLHGAPVSEVRAMAERVAGRAQRTMLLSRHDGPLPSLLRGQARVAHLRAPAFFRGHQAWSVQMLRAGAAGATLLLADAADDPVLALLLASAARRADPVEVMLPEQAPAGPAGTAWLQPSAMARRIMAGGPRPRLVLDAARETGFALWREAFELAGVPCLAVPGGHGGEARLFAAFEAARAALADPASLARPDAMATRQEDPGWALVWSMVRQLRSSGPLGSDR